MAFISLCQRSSSPLCLDRRKEKHKSKSNHNNSTPYRGDKSLTFVSTGSNPVARDDIPGTSVKIFHPYLLHSDSGISTRRTHTSTAPRIRNGRPQNVRDPDRLCT
jgi:hypothetical protein